MKVQQVPKTTADGTALATALGNWIETPMKRYHLNERTTFEIAAAPCALRWFAAKTNRLALYSLHLPGVELKLYVARDWPEDTLDEDDLIGA